MKNKTTKSKVNRGASRAAAAPEPFPEPHDLLEQAQNETGHSDLKSYAETIATLRRKGFSFREIADWLNARGVPTNHNAVYRVFATCLPGDEADAIEEEAGRGGRA